MAISYSQIEFPAGGGPRVPICQYNERRRCIMVLPIGPGPLNITMFQGLGAIGMLATEATPWLLQWDWHGELCWQVWYALWPNTTLIEVYEWFDLGPGGTQGDDTLSVEGTLTLPHPVAQQLLGRHGG